MAYGILKDTIVTDDGNDANLKCTFTAPLAVRSNQPSYVQESMNLAVSASEQGAQRWEVTTNIGQENGTPNFAVHSVLKGHSQKFKIRTPQIANLKNAVGASVTAFANVVTIAGTAVNLDVISVPSGAYFTEGEFIAFNSLDAKVYMVTESTNLGVVKIQPRLKKALAAGVTIYRGDKVPMLVRYSSDTQLGITFVDGVLSDPGSIKLIEAL